MIGAARRVLVLVALVACIVAGAVVDHAVGRAPAPALSAAPGVTPEVSPTSLQSTAWYCPGGGGTGHGDGAVTGASSVTVLLVDAGPARVAGTITAVGVSGSTRTVAVSVPGRGASSVPISGLVSGGWAAASVSLSGGGVAVSQVVSGPTGWSESPCAPSTASSWYFAHAATANGDAALVSLFNPTVTPADVDVALATSSQGVIDPPDYQEVAVGPDSVSVLDLDDHDLGDPALGVEVTTLSGTVVTDELQVDPAAGAQGLGVQLGSAASGTWCFPSSTVVPGGDVVFRVLDPSDQPARVTVRFGLQQGTAAPVVLDVVPGVVSDLDTATLTRLPAAVAWSAQFTSDGPGVVVSREVTAPAQAPAPEVGETTGLATSGRQWLVGPVPTPGSGMWSLAVVGATNAPTASRSGSVTVTVSVLGPHGLSPVAGLTRVHLVAGSPLVVGPGSPPPSGILVVSASAPVGVELDPLPVGAPGAVVTPAFAFSASAA